MKVFTEIIVTTAMLLPLVLLGQGVFELSPVARDSIRSESEINNYGRIDTVQTSLGLVLFIDAFPDQISYLSQNDGVISLGTYVRHLDTVIVDRKAYVVSNKFQDVFMSFDTLYSFISEDSSSRIFRLIPRGEPTIQIYSNGQLKSICVLQTLEGTLKIYYDEKGRKISDGYFWCGLKSGLWNYYGRRGNIIGYEKYVNGKLILSSGKTPE